MDKKREKREKPSIHIHIHVHDIISLSYHIILYYTTAISKAKASSSFLVSILTSLLSVPSLLFVILSLSSPRALSLSLSSVRLSTYLAYQPISIDLSIDLSLCIVLCKKDLDIEQSNNCKMGYYYHSEILLNY